MTLPAGAALSLAAAACNMPQLPGDEVGRYAISGTLVENSCGQQAVAAADPLQFEAQLRNDDGRGYWVTDPPAIPGRLSPDGEFSFRFDSTADVGAADAMQARLESPSDFTDPERFDEQPDETGCRLRVDEEVRGRVLRGLEASIPGEALDAGGAEYDLEGENEIQMRALSGFDCSRALATRGGPFDALPCVVRYEITGELLAE